MLTVFSSMKVKIKCEQCDYESECVGDEQESYDLVKLHQARTKHYMVNRFWCIE